MRFAKTVLTLATLTLVEACGGITQPLGDVSPGGNSGNAGSSSTINVPSNTPNPTPGINGLYSDDGPCMTECAAKVFRFQVTTCKLCHYANMPNATPPMPSLGQLDLVSPRLEARLKDVPAKHVEITLGPGITRVCPTGDLLIDSGNPEESWLLKKIRQQQGTCGDKMPSTSQLRADEQQCLETFVYCEAARSP